MPFSVNDQITELRRIIGVDDDDDGFTDSGCLLLLNRAWWALMDTFQFREKEKTVYFQTVAGVNLYQVPQPFEATRQISIEDINDMSHMTLDFMTPLVYESVYVNDSNAWAKPTNYTREGDAMRLWPVPDDIYNMTLKYWFPFQDLTSGSTPPVPQIWHEIVLYQAASKAYMMIQDHSRAFSIGSYADTLLARINPTEGKEERDTRNASLAVRRNDRQ